MKKYLAILGLFFCANCFADNIEINFNGRYAINHVISKTPDQTYILMCVHPERGYIYGGHIMFEPESQTFESYYAAPCGNDCFPSSQGTYQMEGEQHVRLHLTHISQDGDCENYDRDVQQDLGVFLIEINEANGSMTLTAVDALSQ